MYVERTSSTSNTSTVNLQNLDLLKNEFNLSMKTNDTVKLRVEVWNDGSVSGDDKVRTISDIEIPFNKIPAKNTWTTKQLTLGGPTGHFKIEIKISCDQHFGGMGCNYCLEHSTGENCDVC